MAQKKKKKGNAGSGSAAPAAAIVAGCQNKNPLQLGGTSQQQRSLAGLKDNYVLVNEKHVGDWIFFAGEFGRYLQYFDKTNTAAGNWQLFFTSDISATLGVAAIQNIQVYQQAVKAKFDLLKSDDYNHDDHLLKTTLGSLFGAILTLSQAIDAFNCKIPGDFIFKETFQSLITTKFQPAIQKLLAYYKGALANDLIIETADVNWKIFNTPLQKPSDVIAGGLSKLWVKGSAGWTEYYNSIIADKSIYTSTSADVYPQINHAANHNLFAGLFDQFLMGYAKLVNDAEKELLLTLTNYNNHHAHYALFLSFLRLFKHSTNHINGITRRHLDFYYNDVLRLYPKQAGPNSAHVVIELAKQVSALLLKKDTLFKAGKDASGKEILYAATQDVVINKGVIAQLKAVYKASSADTFTVNGVTINNTNRLFAAPVINSADGFGKPLETANQEWHPYVNKKFVDGNLLDVVMPKASVGFAVASHYLLLGEGQRIVNIKFVTGGSTVFPASLAVDCFLTTEKGWYHTPEATVISGTTSESTAVKMLTLTLPGDAPAIANYNATVHGGTYGCTIPILKVYLKNLDNQLYAYTSLQGIELSKIEVEVKVGLEQTTDYINPSGIKNLMLSNDNGIIDAAKPFYPFGLTPKKGASLTIGNEEVMKKKNAQVKFRAGWAEMPYSHYDIDYENTTTAEGDYAPKVTLKYLAQGIWKTLVTALDIFYYWYTDVDVPLSGLTSLGGAAVEVGVPYDEPYTFYDIKTKNGFLKWTLNDGFNYDKYEADKIQYNIDKALGRTATNPDPAPYIPKLGSLTLHYKAASIVDVKSVTNFNERSIRFFHIHPFGEAEQHVALHDGPVRLLPQLALSQHNLPAEDAGEMYIGLQHIAANDSVQILFQLLEGTTNPLLDKPEVHVHWHYLSNNAWKPFADDAYTDSTLQLIQSGIIAFTLPADITTNNTLLPAGFVWLRASVNTMAEAVCKFLSVQAQAVLVKYVADGIDFNNTTLAAGKIVKLKEANALIKKIAQPYATFGGRQKETNNQYDVRVSERLRHKARAITIWDYEHLVLEAFPDLHRVKCLNHTKFEGNDYNEVAPGHVTIVTIPNLLHRNEVNLLRPYTRQDVLAEIEAYLKSKISCHVQLHVRHPQFEEVRLAFEVKFFDGLAFNFYKNQLQQEITSFLTPWAFGQTTQVDFGGEIHKSVLINFIEERSYVDYITQVKMYHRRDETSPVESGDLDTITATTAKSILVSAAAAKHVIVEIVEADVAVVPEDCIDEWNAGKSFK